MNSSLSGPASVDFEQLTPAAPAKPAPSRADAAQQARRLVAAAEAEADRIRDEARTAGQAEGYAAGRDEALAQLAPNAQAMIEALTAVRSLEADAVDRVEREAVELALHVAERVVSGTIAVEPERLLDIVRGALRTIVERERVTILVHPDDLDLMREGMADVTGSLGGIEHLEVQEERRVGRGGAIIRTSFGEVDARIETKLERAREAMKKELAR
jgi:flagellar biosynthesis/type III secretory pathway protein FliH